jgi:hypothetical protein
MMSRKTREDGRKKRTCCIVIIKCLLTIKYKHKQKMSFKHTSPMSSDAFYDALKEIMLNVRKSL